MPLLPRQIACIVATEGRLKARGVESVGIVATAPEIAQLDFKFRPTRLRLGADPEMATHRPYGIRKPAIDAATIEALSATRIKPTGELPAPLPVREALTALAGLEGYVESPPDRDDRERQIGQLKAQSLIDRDGNVRWANIERAAEAWPAWTGSPATTRSSRRCRRCRTEVAALNVERAESTSFPRHCERGSWPVSAAASLAPSR